MELPTVFHFLKSTRSIAVIVVVLALSGALFFGRVSAEQYITIASVIVSAYFAKRDEPAKPEDSGSDSDR